MYVYALTQNARTCMKRIKNLHKRISLSSTAQTPFMFRHSRPSRRTCHKPIHNPSPEQTRREPRVCCDPQQPVRKASPGPLHASRGHCEDPCPPTAGEPSPRSARTRHGRDLARRRSTGAREGSIEGAAAERSDYALRNEWQQLPGNQPHH